MTKEVQQYVIERSKELIAAATACQEVKDAAHILKNWKRILLPWTV